MRTMSSLILILGLLALAGCASYDDEPHSATSMVLKDACTMCAGDQTITATGTCPKCGMKVDCCASCPGTQALAADGKCPGCGMKVKAM